MSGDFFFQLVFRSEGRAHFVLDLLQVYGGSARMEFLQTLFPGVDTKHTLATAEELQPFAGKASQLAALDYHVSVHSDIFISASRGNMHNSVVSIQCKRS